MCILVEKCCFCVDLETATRSIALIEAVLAVPCFIQGLASLSVISLATGLMLFISAWVLFDGAFLKRKGLLMGWLVATIFKVLLCFALGTVFSYLTGENESLWGNVGSSQDSATTFLAAIRRMGKSYISCILDWTDQETLFFVVYAITFFSCSFTYMYFFAVVFSYRDNILKAEREEKRRRRKIRHYNKIRYEQPQDLEYYL